MCSERNLPALDGRGSQVASELLLVFRGLAADVASFGQHLFEGHVIPIVEVGFRMGFHDLFERGLHWVCGKVQANVGF